MIPRLIVSILNNSRGNHHEEKKHSSKEYARTIHISALKYRYQTVEFNNFDIHLKTLKDKQQFCDDADEARNVGINDTLWSIFGVVWPAGFVMAKLMEVYDVNNKSILEVGAGIALSSHVLNKRNANITVTDYHPESQRFLAENVKLNNGKSINFYLSDWRNENSQLGQFDLIIGSDLLYEDVHPKLLAKFINLHVKDKCEVILVSPVRGEYQNEFNEIMLQNSFIYEKIPCDDVEYFDGFIHKFNR